MEKNILRSRVGEREDRSVIRFLSSIEDDRAIFDDDVVGTEVHDLMLYACGILSFDELRAILGALEKVRREGNSLLADAGSLPYEDVHPVVEARVIKLIGLDIGGKLHSARSRNDQVNVDARLKVRRDLLELLGGLDRLAAALLSRAGELSSLPAPLYTHLQPAQTGVFGHYFLHYCAGVLRSVERLQEAFRRVNQNPLGACAVGGTSFPIDRRVTTVLLGFDSSLRNSLDAVSARDCFLEVLADLAILAADLSRLAEDLILFSSHEFGFVELSDDYSSTSSALPQKKNPDTLELVKGKAGEFAGKFVQVFSTVKGTPSGYVRDFQEVKPPLFSALESMKLLVSVTRGAVLSLKVVPSRMEVTLRGGKLNALDIAEFLVQEHGLSFRQAHECVGNLIGANPAAPLEEVLTSGAIEEFVARQYHKEVSVDQEALSRHFDPLYCLNRRKSAGSPNPSDVAEQVEAFSSWRAHLRKRTSELVDKLKAAEKLRGELVDAALAGDEPLLLDKLEKSMNRA
ncbi:MAG: argininosuccinate lyase [Promethearchaeota archaeon]